MRNAGHSQSCQARMSVGLLFCICMHTDDGFIPINQSINKHNNMNQHHTHRSSVGSLPKINSNKPQRTALKMVPSSFEPPQ